MLKNVKIWKVTVVKPARKKVVCRLSGSPRKENTFESFQKVLTLPYFTGHNCQSCIVYLNLDHLKVKKSHLIQEHLISLSSLSLLLAFLLNNKDRSMSWHCLSNMKVFNNILTMIKSRHDFFSLRDVLLCEAGCSSPESPVPTEEKIANWSTIHIPQKKQ